MFVSFSTIGQTINLTKIAKIESNFDSTAINPAGDCYGLFQISEICLKEYNLKHKTNYKIKDLFSVAINGKIAKWYFEVRIPQLLKAYGYKITINNKIICYNAGINTLVKNKEIPSKTVWYINQYKK